MIEPCPLPEDASLRRYRRDPGYVDCYATTVAGRVSQADYVAAFYTSWLFRLERLVLSWALGVSSSDDDAARFASGSRDWFAAWDVEARDEQQLLLRDYTGNTRSWLMVAPLADGDGTRLYFGSAVVPRPDPATGRVRMDATYRRLLGFHRLYSRLLLRAARDRLLSRMERRQACEGDPGR